MEFEERTQSVAVPRHAGIAGLLSTISGILKEIPRVKSITVRNTGEVVYTWTCPTGQESSLPVFTSLEFKDSLPSSILRNVPMQEVQHRYATTPANLAYLLQTCVSHHLHPIAFCIGTPTYLWDSFRGLAGWENLTQDNLMGYPIFIDDTLPPEAVVLCAGLGRSYELLDTCKAFKTTVGDV